MTPKSAKAKGRLFQNEIFESILEVTGLKADHFDKALMGESGADIKPRSKVARKKFPYQLECKKQESFQTWKFLAAMEKLRTRKMTPLLVFRRNKTPAYVALRWQDFCAILVQLYWRSERERPRAYLARGGRPKPVL